MSPRPLGARGVKDVPKLRAAQFLQPPSAEAGPEGSTGSRGTAPIDTINHFAGIGFDTVSNQVYGTCCPTGIGNLIRLTSGYYTDRQIQPSSDDVYDLYRRAGNPGFVPGVSVQDGPDDQGCYIQDALDEVRINGMGAGKYGRVYALAHATVDHTNEAELKQAMQIFGGLLYQTEISAAQDAAYEVVYAEATAGIPVDLKDPDTWWDGFSGEDRGAHVTVAGAYEPTEMQDIITWGYRIPTTRNYRQVNAGRLQEVWIVIWPWTLEHPNFQEGVDYDALQTAYHALTGGNLPPQPTPTSIAGRWKSGKHVGAAKPRANVMVRRGHYHRRYSADGVWQAVWVADSDWMVIPNITQITLESSFDSNGVTVATVQMDNVGYINAVGALGDPFHKIERGWFSPLRAYKAPGRPSLFHEPNEWDRLLTDSVEIHISQGYGDQIVPTFSGLIDSATVGDLPDQITLSCRDFGLNLVDSKLFGWNIDPDKRDPVTFYDRGQVQQRLDSKVKATRDEGALQQKKGVLIDDLSDMVRIACRWGGWNVNNMRIDPTGNLGPHGLKAQGIVFDVQSTLMDIIKKACDLTGFIFYIEPASGAHPNGRPVFKQSEAAGQNPPIFTEIRDDQLLTGVQYQTDNTQKASIIRVRGKLPKNGRGGLKLGGDQTLGITGLYRPPWHKTIYLTGTDRDARVLRHEIHQEPLFTTQHECDLAAQLIAFRQALAATTATVEIPAYPYFYLDRVLTLMDRPSGINSRMWLAHITSTQTLGQNGTYKMSLGVALLDNPDVSEVVKDLIVTWAEPNLGITGW